MSTNKSNNKKHLSALMVALGMTLVVGLAMLALGANALFNKNVTSAEAAPAATEIMVPDNATIEDLQAVIAEYQAREVQYQDELTQAADQLNQANAQVVQYQSLITDLQNTGVIQIDSNGKVTVTSPQLGLGNQGFGHAEHEEQEGFWGDDD